MAKTQSHRTPLVSIALIALAAHQVNKAYCEAQGDTTQPPWDKAPDWQKTSIINGVVFHLQNDASPQASHESWMAEKLKEGWTYGAEKNPAKKEHPCLVSYHLLPIEQKAKDYLFRGIVHALSIPTPEGDGDTIPVVNVDQFAGLLGQWHSNTVAKVKQMGEIPDGTDVDIDGKKVTLTGDAMTGFQIGLLTTLAEFQDLPFLASGGEPPAANDAAAPSN